MFSINRDIQMKEKATFSKLVALKPVAPSSTMRLFDFCDYFV